MVSLHSHLPFVICLTISGCSSLVMSSSSLPRAVVKVVSDLCKRTIESLRCWSSFRLSWEIFSRPEEPGEGKWIEKIIPKVNIVWFEGNWITYYQKVKCYNGNEIKWHSESFPLVSSSFVKKSTYKLYRLTASILKLSSFIHTFAIIWLSCTSISKRPWISSRPFIRNWVKEGNKFISKMKTIRKKAIINICSFWIFNETQWKRNHLGGRQL